MNPFFHIPNPKLKCKICHKKNCKLLCPHCNTAYCDSPCTVKDLENHRKLCAKFWCIVDREERKDGHFNPVPCEGLRRKYICYGCHEIKQNKTKLCGNCKHARYCSVECQQKNWEAFHQARCSTYRTFRRTQKRRKKFMQNGAKFPDKEISYWSILKNGKPLPKKYQTKREAIQDLVQLIKNKKDGIYVLGIYHLCKPPPLSKPHH